MLGIVQKIIFFMDECIIIILCLPLICLATPITNDREGESSFYSTNRIFKIKENLKEEYIKTLQYLDGIKGRTCTTDIYETVKGFFPEGESSVKLIKNALIYARYNNAIDDIVLRNLIHINKHYQTPKIKLPITKEKTKLTEAQQATFKRNGRSYPAGKGPCLSDKWTNIYRDLIRTYEKKKIDTLYKRCKAYEFIRL